jgi:head-tail adaptor
MTAAAGLYVDRLRIERRGVAGDDGYGNVLQAWAPLVTRWARVRSQAGREAVAAGRIESTGLGVMAIRRDATTATITAADRVVFVTGPRSGIAANIRAVRMTDDGTEVEMTIEMGVAV